LLYPLPYSLPYGLAYISLPCRYHVPVRDFSVFFPCLFPCAKNTERNTVNSFRNMEHRHGTRKAPLPHVYCKRALIRGQKWTGLSPCPLPLFAGTSDLVGLVGLLRRNTINEFLDILLNITNCSVGNELAFPYSMLAP
jgi:hypothetical protein